MTRALTCYFLYLAVCYIVCILDSIFKKKSIGNTIWTLCKYLFFVSLFAIVILLLSNVVYIIYLLLVMKGVSIIYTILTIIVAIVLTIIYYFIMLYKALAGGHDNN